ncbi:MAG: glycine/betaine/sarcosine/D-proline family reductase selenoprotein B [Chloroflexi bacterium]|nr:glycine/betaine/sarcosine/D-proline family reductase selenoprotein B [Chloroflexota bacterium]
MIVREIEKAGIPVAFITPVSQLGHQMGANRVIAGTKVPHPCGDPGLPPAADRGLRKKIVETALVALQTDVDGPTIFKPDVTFSVG